MSTDGDVPALERVTFFEGQRLTAADLTATQTYQREMRWLHNRSLHGWGVARGLAVTGAKGAGAVTIAPGYGLDPFGREVVLVQPHAEPVPPVAGGSGGEEVTYFLTLGYTADDAATPLEARDGVCLGHGAVRLREAPRVAWRRPGDAELAGELVVAQVWVLNCRLNRPASIAVRREIRESTQAHIAAGSTPPGKTPWTFWDVGTGQNRRRGVQTIIDTSTGRFRRTPQYLAHVAGERELAVPSGGQRGQLADGFVRIFDETPTAFTLGVLMPAALKTALHDINPASLLQSTTLLGDLMDRVQWHVVWMGIEG